MTFDYDVKETDRFAVAGSDGASYVVVELTHILRHTRFENDPLPTIVEGRREYAAWPGNRRVVAVGDHFEIAGTSIFLRRQ